MERPEQNTGWARAAFAGWERTMNGEAATHLHSLRRNGLEEFLRRGYPTTREEEWRFTNVMPVASTEFAPVLSPFRGKMDRGVVRGFLGDGWASARAVFINGHLAPDLSSLGDLQRGVHVRGLAEALAAGVDPALAAGTDPAFAAGTGQSNSGDAFAALNLAFLQDGAFITIDPATDVAGPIHILFISADTGQPFLQTPRILLRAGAGSRASIVVSYHSLDTGTHLTSAVANCWIGAGAAVEFDIIQNEGRRAFHVSSLRVEQEQESSFASTSIPLGGAIVRNTVSTRFTGERGECTLNGLTLATGDELVDNHTAIDHAMPNCTSHELYKAILDGSAHGVFNGKIFVRQDAQKTDARQTNRTLLLSDSATIDTKPQLEIVADDVKCTHGATVGRLEDEQLFYCRSRGIDLDAARDMLTFAFAGDIINRMQIAPVREALDRMIHARLSAGRLTDIA